MKRWRAKLLICLGACLSLPLMLRWFEHNQVYHPSRVMDATGAELGRPFEDVYFDSEDGVQLNGWFFPGNTSLVVLLCHGNGGNISHRLEMADALLTTGVSVFLFDYRGYGRSRGHPSEEGTYRDGIAAYQWLRQRGFDGKHILLFGESLGGGVGQPPYLRRPDSPEHVYLHRGYWVRFVSVAARALAGAHQIRYAEQTAADKGSHPGDAQPGRPPHSIQTQ